MERTGIAAAMVCAIISVVVSRARASFTDDFSYAAGSSPPSYYTIKGEQLEGSKLELTGSTMNLRSSKTGASGSTRGYVPTLQVSATGVGSTWMISTVVSADWYGGNELTGSYPSLGLLISDSTNNAMILIKRDTTNHKDYMEIGYNAESNVGSSFSSRVASTSTTAYTIRIEKMANGSIQFGTSIAGMSIVETISATSTDSNDLAAYNLLNAIGGKTVGLYVNGQSYSSTGTALYLTASFDNLTLTGLNVVGVPEAASLGLLVFGAAGLWLRKK